MTAEKYLLSIGIDSSHLELIFNSDDKSYYSIPELMEAYMDTRSSIDYNQEIFEKMRATFLKSREETARVREYAAIKQTLEIYCTGDGELPTVEEVLKRI